MGAAGKAFETNQARHDHHNPTATNETEPDHNPTTPSQAPTGPPWVRSDGDPGTQAGACANVLRFGVQCRVRRNRSTLAKGFR